MLRELELETARVLLARIKMLTGGAGSAQAVQLADALATVHAVIQSCEGDG